MRPPPRRRYRLLTLMSTAYGARLGNWPLIAIHSILTRDGRVLTFGTDGNGAQTGRFIYDVWDPRLANDDVSAEHNTLGNFTATDLFVVPMCCCRAVILSSSRVAISTRMAVRLTWVIATPTCSPGTTTI